MNVGNENLIVRLVLDNRKVLHYYLYQIDYDKPCNVDHALGNDTEI